MVAKTGGKYKIELKQGRTARKKYYWFRVVHRNGRIIATSEVYKTQRAAKDTAGRFASYTALEITKED
jgi:uncharacterized protein YegP (UPF0339 family)